jgi:hypothetical protein
MIEEPDEQSAVLTRLDELVAILRSVDRRLQELVAAHERVDYFRPVADGLPERSVRQPSPPDITGT